MFTITQDTGVKLTTCVELGKAMADRAQYVSVIGKYICHTGTQVWVELDGCGQTDSHQFNHIHDNIRWFNEAFNGKLVRIEGRRNYDYRYGWNYMWTVYSVNGMNR